MPTRNASAVWEGGLQGGKGTFSGESEAIGGPYSFGSRFQETEGSNPEELLGAALASCYSMALSAALEKAGTPPTRVESRAATTLEKVGDAFKVTTIKLDVRASVPNVDNATFQRFAMDTKDGCIISRTMKGNVAIEVDAKLE